MLKTPLFIFLVLSFLTACSPVRAGVVSDKYHKEAYSETRSREALKVDCGWHKKKITDLTKTFGCGRGYFEEDYEVRVRECWG